MPLLSIRLSAWRNLADGLVDLASPRVFLIGENGEGKSNLLEAIYYLSYGSSFRGQVDAAIPRRGEDYFSAEGSIVRDLAAEELPADFIWGHKRR